MSNSSVIIVEEVDGFEIVKGIDKLTIDPIATRKIVQAEIVNTPEYKTCKEKQDAMNDLFNQAGDKLKQSNVAMAKRNKIQADKLYREYKDYYNEALELMKEVRSLLPAVKKAEKELITTHAIYFEPGRHERKKSESEIEDIQNKIKTLSVNKLMKSDGTEIDNFKGISFFHKVSGKWVETHVKKIGEDRPANSKIFDELSDTEKTDVLRDINIKRVSLLTRPEKEKEKEKVLKDALAEATIKRSKLEISGVPDALEQSQQWYNDRVGEINDLYK